MAEVASAFVSLVPSARGFGRSTERQLGGEMGTAGAGLGKKLGRSLFGAAAAVGAAMGVSRLFSDSIGEAREAQKVGALTVQVIKSTGGAARVSAKHVGKLSTAISNKIGVDDEAIQSGANMLLTFKNIRNEAGKGNKIFDQTVKTTADVAAAMAAASGGELNFRSASIQVGKALNDPIKGITALSRVGVTFTDQQKEQIKALVASGDTMKAQKIILKELTSEFGGAAASQATAGDKAKVALKNLEETIGTALLPVMDTLSRTFTNKIAPALSNFVDDIGPAAGKVKKFFTNGDGAKPLAKAMGLISDAVGTVKDGLGTAADNFGRLRDAVGGFDLSKLDGKKLGESLGTAVLDGLKFLSQSTGKILGILSDVFGKVDWVGLGITIGKQAPALLLGLAAGILNFDLGSLLRGVGDHWFDILMGVLVIAFAPSKFLGPLERILTKIPFVGRFLAAAVKWLNDLGGQLKKFGGDLFKSFAEGFGKVKFPGAGLISRVMDAFKQLPAKILNFWVTLQVRLGVWALDAFGAAGRGARTAVGRLLGYVGTIGGKILRGVGNLGSLLFNAGKELIQGLINGITSKIKDLTGAVGKVAGIIKDHFPGSPVRRGPLTSWNNGGAGKRLVGLLVDGLSSTTSVDAAATRLASRIAVPIAPAFGGGAAGGAGSVVDAEQASYRAFTRALSATGTVIMSKDNLRDLDLLVGAG